jgi:hypothetical protein
LATLEPLVRRHPDNVEAVFDLERVGGGLAECEAALAKGR